MKKYFRLGFYQILPITSLTLSPLALTAGQCLAQIILKDETLGAEQSQVKAIDAMNDQIDGGARRGSSLFHSFQRFSIQNDHSASFSNPAGVTNIFSRVTGDQASRIDGTLRVLGDANLFLINPRGIIFGIGGSLDLKGSFIASTASNILFSNGSQFGTITPQSIPLLTVEALAPIGLQFEGKPSRISLARSATESFDLTVQPGKTLALIGGDIQLSGYSTQSGTLRALGGRVELGGLAENGVVQLSNNLQDLHLIFPADKIRSDVSLSNAARVTTTSTNGGSISVYARNLELSENSKLLGGINVVESTSDAKAGNITINVTEKVNLRNGSRIANDLEGNAPKGITNFLNQAGDIQITAYSISLSEQSIISSGTRGKGNAGVLKINANDRIDIDESFILNTVGLGATGNSGGIEVVTGSLNATNYSLLSVAVAGSDERGNTQNLPPGNGNAGSLTIHASSQVNIDGGSQVLGTLNRNAIGAGGILAINTKTLALSNQSKISTSSNGKGKAGSLTINASNQVDMSGKATYILSGLNEDAIGEGGDVTINTDFLRLSDSALISTGTEGKGKAGSLVINALTAIDINKASVLSTVNNNAIGNGGSITINTKDLSVVNGAILSTGSEGNGDAGSLTVNTNGKFLIDYGAKVNSTLEGGKGKGGEVQVNTSSLVIANKGILQVSTERSSSDAGNIKVDANSVYLSKDGKIEARTESGNGGKINLNIRNLLLLRSRGGISTTAGASNADGNGGSITINASNGLIIAALRQNSDIAANAFSGDGGRVKINARSIFGLISRSRDELKMLLGTSEPKKLDPVELPTNDITAISQQDSARNGEVNLNAPINLDQRLNQVPKEPRSTVVADSCQVINGKESVQFFDIGRGGLPPRPEDPLSVDLLEWTPTVEIAGQPSSSLFMPQTKSGIDMNLPDRASRSFQTSSTYLKLLPPCQSR